MEPTLAQAVIPSTLCLMQLASPASVCLLVIEGPVCTWTPASLQRLGMSEQMHNHCILLGCLLPAWRYVLLQWHLLLGFECGSHSDALPEKSS